MRCTILKFKTQTFTSQNFGDFKVDLIKTHLMARLNDAQHAKMKVSIHFLMNITVNNQLDLDLVDTCLGHTL